MKKLADKIFVNGKAYTLEREGDLAEAIVIKDGKFEYVGTNEYALEHYHSAEIIDLKGKTVLPGMGDSHMHFFAFCQTFTTVDLGGATSKAEVIKRLAEKAAQLPEGEWIKGSNFDQSKWTDADDKLPTREDLDKATTKHPIVIKRVCLHTTVVNTLALEKANIGKGYRFGAGGTVELDEDDMPNGIFREQASSIYDELIPDPLLIPENKDKYIKQGLDIAAQYGLTMIHSYAAEVWKYSEDFNYYIQLNRNNQLPVRMTVCLDYLYNKPFVTEAERQDPFRTVQYGSYKIFCDGSLGSRSAKLFEPYEDDKTTDGILVMSQEELNRKVLEGYEMGLQPAIHCIGDKGLDCVITAIEYTLEKSGEKGMTEREQRDRLPFRIIHAQMANPELVKRMTKLPIVLDIQPSFFLTDLHWIKDRVGEKRAAMSYTWKTYQDAGLMLTGGSDCPVESFSPWNGIYAAVTRKDLNGYPKDSVQPEEKLSVYDAVCLFSKNIPYANGEEDLMGTIKAGKFADMVVIDRNIFETPEDDIKEVQVLNTYLAGRETFRRL
jgi:hypothetical protein